MKIPKTSKAPIESRASPTPGENDLARMVAPNAAESAADRPIRILIVDGVGIIRQALKLILAKAFPKASLGEANNGTEAMERISETPWDVVLLELAMPGKSGLDVLKQMVDAQPNMAVLVRGMHPEHRYAVRVLKLGAAGYLTKNKAPEEVVSAVKKVVAGGKYVSPALAEDLAASLEAPPGKSTHELLSDREYQVMRLIAVGRSVREIAFDLSLSVKTISTHHARIMEKLKLKTNADVIRYAVHHELDS
jgi:DNA-binding NarL/FixJ family response regulator